MRILHINKKIHSVFPIVDPKIMGTNISNNKPSIDVDIKQKIIDKIN